MTTLFLVRELVCLLFLAVLARGDFRRLKIRNRLVLAGALCGTGLAALAGPAAAGSALGGGLTALALGFLLWRLSAFGAGDAKLLGMLGCFCGFAPLWQHLAAALLAAGVCALAVLLVRRQLRARLRRVRLYFRGMLLTHQWAAYEPAPDDSCRFPFAVPVFAGELLWFLLRLLRAL